MHLYLFSSPFEAGFNNVMLKTVRTEKNTRLLNKNVTWMFNALITLFFNDISFQTKRITKNNFVYGFPIFFLGCLKNSLKILFLFYFTNGINTLSVFFDYILKT